MQKILLVSSLILLCGCTFIYDSRNQNSLNVGRAEYKGTELQDGKFKTGRFIEIRILQACNRSTEGDLCQTIK